MCAAQSKAVSLPHPPSPESSTPKLPWACRVQRKISHRLSNNAEPWTKASWPSKGHRPKLDSFSLQSLFWTEGSRELKRTCATNSKIQTSMRCQMSKTKWSREKEHRRVLFLGRTSSFFSFSQPVCLAWNKRSMKCADSVITALVAQLDQDNPELVCRQEPKSITPSLPAAQYV